MYSTSRTVGSLVFIYLFLLFLGIFSPFTKKGDVTVVSPKPNVVYKGIYFDDIIPTIA